MLNTSNIIYIGVSSGIINSSYIELLELVLLELVKNSRRLWLQDMLFDHMC